MLVKKGTKLSSYDNERFVISTESDRHYVINGQVSNLYKILNKSDDWDEAHRLFQEKYQTAPDLKAFKKMVHATLGEKGILQKDKSQSVRESKFLRLRQQVIPGHIAAKIVAPFTFLFSRKWFGWLMASLVVVNGGVALYGSWVLGGHYVNQFTMWMFPLLFTTTVIHEFGHIAACRAFGANHGGIGFGFYFIYPVNYADVNGVWVLDKKERIIVNLAGIYFEMFYALFLSCVFSVLQYPVFLFVASLVTLNTARQLYPFFRLDGYWVLSDWLGIPNLITNSRKQVVKLGNKIISFLKNQNEVGRRERWNKKDLFLLFYGLANGLITVFFIAAILIRYWQDVLNFPEHVVEIIWQIVNGYWGQIEVSFGFLLVTVFYVLIVRFCAQQIIKKFKKDFMKHVSREHVS